MQFNSSIVMKPQHSFKFVSHWQHEDCAFRSFGLAFEVSESGNRVVCL